MIAFRGTRSGTLFHLKVGVDTPYHHGSATLAHHHIQAKQDTFCVVDQASGIIITAATQPAAESLPPWATAGPATRLLRHGLASKTTIFDEDRAGRGLNFAGEQIEALLSTRCIIR